ncbi:MAG TPA: efflux RND transporter periplasmic adaptor subunit, partial [Kofleriaceae bacterium]|nr:efflux RND transporter periplasmic adaptor subunit [Kofleriaceae bacterium]
ACGGHAHEHAAAEARTESLTRWTQAHEFFAEHPPLVVGQRAAFAVHVTRLEGHAPVGSGTLTATVRPRSGAPIAVTVGPSGRAGIFLPELTPTSPGPCTLTLRLDPGAQGTAAAAGAAAGPGAASDEVTVDCEVHAAGAKLPPADEDPPGRISFLKEAAWSTDLATEAVGERELIPTLRTTGEIRATAGREARLTATAHGRVLLEEPVPVLGAQIAAGQVLARIIPQIENAGDRVTLASEARQARAELAAAESQLARSERLWAERTIPEKQLEEARTRVELARARLDAAQGKLGQFDAGAAGRAGGRTAFQVRSPLAGTLVAIHVSSGQTVEDGELLFTVVDLSRIWLHADVFEPDIAAVEGATRASFRVDGYDRPIAIAPPDGRVVTIGKLVSEKTRTVPMIFELPNPDQRIRIGSFATVWIETGAPVRALAIPETAIVDDAGRKVAYVQASGESFERRVLALGIRSGGWAQVEAGLGKGERVVTRGAYDIKLAAAGGAVPEHGHAH